MTLPHSIEGVEHLHWKGEYDGGILLSRDGVECLGVLSDNLWSVKTVSVSSPADTSAGEQQAT